MPEFRDCVGTGTNRAKTDGLVREIESLNACFQSVMKASYVMKAARHACTHNHSCILLGYVLLVAVNSSALQAVEWCNPSTSCYGFCCSIAIIASGDGRPMVVVVICLCVCACT